MSDKQSDQQQKTNESIISNQPKQNQDLSLWVTSVNGYKILKKNVGEYQKSRFTYSADGKTI